MIICNGNLSEVYNSEVVNGEFIIPNIVKSIGDYAFEECHTLKSIVIPNSVESIGSFAFAGCDNLKSIVIPNSVTSIGCGAFNYCKSLTSVTIGNSVTSIGCGAFNYCKSLTSVKKNYKAFNLVKGKLYCRNLELKENIKTTVNGELEICRNGLHFCTNLFEIFNHYYGEIDEDIAIYECEVGDKVLTSDTSKCCTNWIIPKKRLYRQDVIKILNGENEI